MDWIADPTEHGLRIPIKSWCHILEDGAREQAKNLARLPFAYKHIALMPDCHQGYGMPIGGVMCTDQVIVPNAVGVDIGCGMLAMRLTARDVFKDSIKSIMGEVRKVVPVGFSHQKRQQQWEGFDSAEALQIPIIKQELDSARKQLGTLGGGNHFIEIQRGSDDHIWLMVHSGSRNIGLKIAKTYHNHAKECCERFYSAIPHKDLSFLPFYMGLANEYMDAMNFAMEFARINRAKIMDKVCEIACDELLCSIEHAFDVHHNYARWENWFGKNVMVHRKGATSAKKGELGIIPGSQGTKSYIVEGLGNPESFNSCSHGAGRTMSRTRARQTLSLQETIYELDKAGIVHSIRNEKDLDEAPGAYKDISEVMEAQKDLVKVKVELTPLGVIKG